jgi:hypothetical protein
LRPNEGALLKLGLLLDSDEEGRVEGDNVRPELVGAVETLGDVEGDPEGPVEGLDVGPDEGAAETLGEADGELEGTGV